MIQDKLGSCLSPPNKTWGQFLEFKSRKTINQLIGFILICVMFISSISNMVEIVDSLNRTSEILKLKFD